MEPQVRFWWLAGIVILAIGIFFLVDGLKRWDHARRLVTEGVRVQAIPTSGNYVRGHRLPAGSQFELAFDYEGRPRSVSGSLEAIGGMIRVGDPVEIRIDPKDPARWTARTEPAPPWASIVGSLPLLPLAGVLIVVAFFVRARVLKIFRQGESIDAVVLDVKQSPVAPMCQIVRCALPGGTDKRVYTVTVPKRSGTLAQGEMIPLLLARSGQPLPAAAYL